MFAAHSDDSSGIDMDSRLEDSPNVLLEVPAAASAADEVCMDLLTASPPTETHVVNFALAESPDERLRTWQTHAGEQLPARFDVIGTAGEEGSTVIDDASTPQTETKLTVQTVPDPGNLTGLSVEVAKFVDSPRNGTTGTPTYGCFHSVTTLLEHVDLRRAFSFLDILTGQVRKSDAVFHYHLSPGAHDRRTRYTLYKVFDLVLRVSEDGTVEVAE